MKRKHISHYIRMVFSLAELSSCVRNRFGAVIIDPQDNVVVSTGYNGSLRGAGSGTCGQQGGCIRDDRGIESGTTLELGCVHAEQNAIYNAARQGVPLVGHWIIINGEPCLLCAKAIKQVGITNVICVSGGYSVENGVHLLRGNGVRVVSVQEDLSDLDLVLLPEARFDRFGFRVGQITRS
jgi:dCMP deaminase